MQLPNSVPESDPANLWAIQNNLISIAENLLGKRDRSKTIYQPVFADDGPRIVNAFSLDGAVVKLSNNNQWC
ncbi:MAG: hypothetical protein ACXWUF_08030 [Methylomagnum sp.]